MVSEDPLDNDPGTLLLSGFGALWTRPRLILLTERVVDEDTLVSVKITEWLRL
jgi:hypothetical protein